jgi:hypothetical protein
MPSRLQPLLVQSQNLPKTANIYQEKKEKHVYRGSTKACAHSLDFQYNNFLYVFFFCQQKMAFVCEFFSIPPYGKYFFLQYSTLLVVIGFCRQVPNSL